MVVCLCVNIYGFTPPLLGVRGGLLSLIVALPGDLFNSFFYDLYKLLFQVLPELSSTGPYLLVRFYGLYNLLFQVPPEISSTGPYLLVRFRSDDTINWKGFSAVYIEGGRAFPPTGNANTLTLPFP